MLSDKQEKFAQSYILHRNASEAAKAAGYAEKHANTQGYRLLQSDIILERIQELENELQTKVNVIDEIESQYAYAKNNGHTNSAIKALELLSRVRGTNSDKVIGLDEESLNDSIINCLNILGEKKVNELVKKCSFNIEEEEEE